MKRKEITVTVLACFLLIAAGAWGGSRLYRAFFHPRSVIEDPTANSAVDSTVNRTTDSIVDSTGWQDALTEYEREIFYPFPFWLESGTISEIDEAYLLSDYYHINQRLYSSVLELADLQWEEVEDGTTAAYEFVSGTAEYDQYALRLLFHIVPSSKGRQDDLVQDDCVIAVNKSGLPVLFWYGSRDLGGMDTEALFCSSLAMDGLPAGTEDYLARLDEILGPEMSYRLFMIDLVSGMPYEGELPEITLAEYYRYGEWMLYSDSATAAYACVINDYHFLLYYDLENSRFCGYSIALNPTR